MGNIKEKSKNQIEISKIENSIDEIVNLEALNFAIEKIEKQINKDSIYIYTKEETNKAQIKLDEWIEKNKINPLEKKNLKKLKLSFHLSSARQKIRDEVGNFLDIFSNNENENKATKKAIIEKIKFFEFCEARLSQYKSGKKLTFEFIGNDNRSDKKKISNFLNEVNEIFNLK